MRRGLELPDATVTDSLKTEVISKLRMHYLDYSRKEVDFSMKYGLFREISDGVFAPAIRCAKWNNCCSHLAQAASGRRARPRSGLVGEARSEKATVSRIDVRPARSMHKRLTPEFGFSGGDWLADSTMKAALAGSIMWAWRLTPS
jgi:hypothetical protein